MGAYPAPTAAVVAFQSPDGTVMLHLLYDMQEYGVGPGPDSDLGSQVAVRATARHLAYGMGTSFADARRQLLIGIQHTPPNRANVVGQPLTDQEEPHMADHKLVDRLAREMRNHDGEAGQRTSMDTYRGWAQAALEALETLDGVTLHDTTTTTEVTT